MGETAWGINPIVLERIQTAYRDMKGGFCGLPLHDSVKSAPLPPMPSQVFRSEVKNGQLTASVSLYTCASSPTLQALLFAAMDHWGHSQTYPPRPTSSPHTPPPPPVCSPSVVHSYACIIITPLQTSDCCSSRRDFHLVMCVFCKPCLVCQLVMSSQRYCCCLVTALALSAST